ncbi:putative zinc finger protein 840 [Armigeres subalbatus]|uniref:putative zinc finger protein 840 n=1 Tax=Armigeres subalbatus TaxID=124917 RepID=UPI002ED21117
MCELNQNDLCPENFMRQLIILTNLKMYESYVSCSACHGHIDVGQSTEFQNNLCKYCADQGNQAEAMSEVPDDRMSLDQENALERWVFQCGLCSGDYLNREALFNHLHYMHNIANEQKERHCKDVLVSYDLRECAVCNDRRGYSEELLKIHIETIHKGICILCAYCGKSFRTHKEKLEHNLNHCDTDCSATVTHADAEVPFQNGSSTIGMLDHAGSMYTQIFSNISILPVLEDSTCRNMDCAEKDVHDGQQNSAAVEVMTQDEEPFYQQHSVTQAENDTHSKEPTLARDQQTAPLELTGHMKKLTSAVVACNQCMEKFPSEIVLQYHRDFKHACEMVPCDRCNAILSSYVELYRHKKKDHTKYFVCTKCNKIFYLDKKITRHCELVHDNNESCMVLVNKEDQSPVDKGTPNESPTGPNSKSKSPQCNVMKISDEKIQTPPSQVVLPPKPTIKCSICPKLFHTEEQLNLHQNKHNEPMISCDQCTRSFITEVEFQEHRDAEHPRKDHLCLRCKIISPSHLELYLHMKDLHQSRFKCSKCMIIFHIKGNVKLHKKFAHKYASVDPKTIVYTKYECSLCPETFRFKHLLSRHEIAHRTKPKSLQYDSESPDETDSETSKSDAEVSSADIADQLSCQTTGQESDPLKTSQKRKYLGGLPLSNLENAITEIVTDVISFGMASVQYDIPKATLYDNILGKKKRMERLHEIPLSPKEVEELLKFSCKNPKYSKIRHLRQPLNAVRDFMTRFPVFREKAEEFKFGDIPFYRWWWAFCRTHGIDLWREKASR